MYVYPCAVWSYIHFSGNVSIQCLGMQWLSDVTLVVPPSDPYQFTDK